MEKRRKLMMNRQKKGKSVTNSSKVVNRHLHHAKPSGDQNACQNQAWVTSTREPTNNETRSQFTNEMSGQNVPNVTRAGFAVEGSTRNGFRVVDGSHSDRFSLSDW